MARLWYNNPHENIPVYVLPDCILLGEEASYQNLEGKKLYLGDSGAFQLLFWKTDNALLLCLFGPLCQHVSSC